MSWLKSIFNKTKQNASKCNSSNCCQNLSQVPTGKSVRIECLNGEEGACQRLREMGFCEQSIVEKIADSGALICKVCDSKVIISKKLAENIIVNDVCQKSQETVLLSHMKLGQKGIIESFVVENDDGERISEMGVTPGEEVEIIRYAPLGDPIEIRIRGYALSIRKDEASFIKVRLI